MSPVPASTEHLPTGWRVYTDRRALIMLFLGFSAGIPILLIFSSLSLWLTEAGIERKAVTYFSWAALGYSFKFVWAPLVDRLPLPLLTGWLGKRRSWLLIAQLLIVTAIVIMGLTNPAAGGSALNWMAAGAVLLGFSAATQDIVIDAYRIELAPAPLQTALAATYNAGYRLGMIVAGAGALYLAEMLGSSKEQYQYLAWQTTYLIMAATMLVGLITTLIIREPVHAVSERRHDTRDYAGLAGLFLVAVSAFVATFSYSSNWFATDDTVSPLTAFGYETMHLLTSLVMAILTGWIAVLAGIVNRQVARETWLDPIADFFRRYGWKTAVVLLCLIGFYRISDIVSGVISNVFYADLGFTKPEIANAVKVFGVVMSLVGVFAGGLLAERFSVMRMMMIGALLASATNLLFVWLTQVGHNLPVMYTAVALDNLASGLAGAVFIAFLSSLTNIRFTATQYAIFSSLMTLIPKVLGGYSGGIVDRVGYEQFFTGTALLGVPVLFLVWLAGRHLRAFNALAVKAPADSLK